MNNPPPNRLNTKTQYKPRADFFGTNRLSTKINSRPAGELPYQNPAGEEDKGEPRRRNQPPDTGLHQTPQERGGFGARVNLGRGGGGFYSPGVPVTLKMMAGVPLKRMKFF